jgi:hypothetical protein
MVLKSARERGPLRKEVYLDNSLTRKGQPYKQRDFRKFESLFVYVYYYEKTLMEPICYLADTGGLPPSGTNISAPEFMQ